LRFFFKRDKEKPPSGKAFDWDLMEVFHRENRFAAIPVRICLYHLIILWSIPHKTAIKE
jgi:hypothetical protein